MKHCSRIILRPLCFLILLGVSSFMLSKLCLMTKQIEHGVTLQSIQLRNKSFSEIETTVKLLLPLNSSASNLARALSSSLNGTELSFQAIQTKVAPTLFLALSTIPQISQVSYIGLGGLMFSFYNEDDQTLAVYSNTSFSSKWYTQPVNRDTGKLYGEAIGSKPMSDLNNTWFQNALNRTGMGQSLLDNGWNKAQDLLFLNIVAMDGRGAISIGFPAKKLTHRLAGIDFHGGDLYLAMNDGRVLVDAKLPDTRILVENGTVSLEMNGVIKDRNNLCKLIDGEACHFSAKIRGIKHIFYCSTLEIAGVPSVYILAFPTKGLESLVHENSKLSLTLLVLIFVTVVVSLCIFITLILRAARREMFLCAALIKKMEATQQAERKSMNKSLAFASASHDVRASLAIITGLVDLCHGQATPNSEMANSLKQINDCAMDLLGILNSVLDMSKIEAGKMQLEEEEFDMEQLLEDVVDMYHPDGTKKGVDVILDPCDGSIFRFNLVKGDRGKLKQILCNLLNNAIKFTSEGHVSVRAVVRKPSKENAIIANSNHGGVVRFLTRLCEKNNGLDEIQTVRQNPNCMEFVFEVEDTGKGIPKEKQKSVFENFVQVKETALRHEGCGLGLGIVQSLVRLMGGEIKVVDKEPGERGTCFRFNIFLPTCDQEIEDQCHTMIGDGTSTDFHHLLGLNRRSPPPRSEGSHVVLLITGEERRKISKRFMETLGIKVSVAKREKDLKRLLENIKKKNNELGMLDYLTKSGSSSSNSGANDGFLGTNIDPYAKKCYSRNLSSFTLIVVDACGGPFLDLVSTVGGFKQDVQNCKVVWLENPIIRAMEGSKGDRSISPPCDQILSKPFHGSRLLRVLNLLPEYGGIYQCHSPRSTSQEMQRVVNSNTTSELRIVIQKDEERSSERPLNGKRVLVVEDTQLLRMLAIRSLSKLGAHVDGCENGKEAFDRVCTALGDQREEHSQTLLPYDYIFMDCEMPVMDGYEATKMIRMEEKHYGIHIPIIALTAHAAAEEASKTSRAGMDFHLTKPLKENKLLEVIQSIERK